MTPFYKNPYIQEKKKPNRLATDVKMKPQTNSGGLRVLTKTHETKTLSEATWR